MPHKLSRMSPWSVIRIAVVLCMVPAVVAAHPDEVFPYCCHPTQPAANEPKRRVIARIPTRHPWLDRCPNTPFPHPGGGRGGELRGPRGVGEMYPWSVARKD